ncbi:hypothetical protein HYH03_009088 [Edaphochlamys debaryana]|uniref:Peptidase M48 domain-containing protein n=1 Tax=Edaphochlamys debaryana TaxID=47281 RepID=A0A836BYU0_9CHLO|nr:hypothetical protein HYH03_009088 [Edaphochlamys debaryana]|eukprot:KAG2492673.1 hypothetical protein HYH03_009088 [Edaphochlamys debaryana]
MAANGAASSLSRLASRLFGGALASRAAAGAVGGSGAGALAAAAGRLPTAAAGTGASFWGASHAAWRSLASEGVGVQPLLPRRALSSITAFGTGAAAATATATGGGPVRRLLGGALKTAAAGPTGGFDGALVAARRMATDAAAGLGGATVVVTRPVAQVPYTGRRRALSLKARAQEELDRLKSEGRESVDDGRLPKAHPSAQLVRRVGAAVAAAACDGAGGGSWEHAKELTWESVVVDDAEPRAWARPSGKVVVTTGMLDFLGVDRNPENGEAALAWVLAREAAHLLARHPEEERSVIYPPTTFCAMMPLVWVVTWMKGHEQRQLEHEADVIALQLVAQAGFNPTGALYSLQKSMASEAPAEQSGFITDRVRTFLQPDPSAVDRVGRVAEHLPRALAEYHKQQQGAGNGAGPQADGGGSQRVA